jgi:outer membrane immunogenic protein
MSRLLIGTAISLGMVASAAAADLPVYTKAPPPQAWSWTGCYVGVEGGGNWGRSGIFDLVFNRDETNPINLTGALAGGTVGCNYQVDRHWVIGVEDDLSWTNKTGSAIDLHMGLTNNIVTENWIDTARGRVGFAMNNWLFYATGGAAFAGSNVQVCNLAGTICRADSQTRTGWTVGGGVEMKLNANWSVKAEYLHADFGNADYFTFPVTSTDARRVSLTDEIVRGGINFKF